MVRYLPPSAGFCDTVSRVPGIGVSQVRSQSHGSASSGGTAPTYDGSDGSTCPVPPLASGEPPDGRRKRRSFASSDSTAMASWRTSLSGGIHAFWNKPSLGGLSSRQL